MIFDLDADPRSELDGYDVCILGSGPAGSTVASELQGKGLRICVLESGRLKRTRHADELKRVTSTGIHVKDYSRERLVGGASTTWAGLSSYFDPIDFVARDGIPFSGWPVSRDNMLPYYEQAAERFRFPFAKQFGDEGFTRLRPKGDIQPAWQRVDEKVFLAAAEPQNFAKECAALWESEDVDLFTDATAVELCSESESGHIVSVQVRTRTGRQVRVQARAFVLASGGIENARLLLNSRDSCPDGLGNEADQVGRFFMNHPKNYHGMIHLDPPVQELPYFFGCLADGFAGYAGLRLPENDLQEQGLLNSYVRLEPIFPWTDNRGIEALVLFVKRSQVLFAFWKRRHASDVVELRDYSETGDDSDLQNADKGWWEWFGLLGTILWNGPRVAQYLFFRLSRKKPRIRKARVRNFMEMEPDPNNRVTLSDEVDAYGYRRAHVEHSCTELDMRSLIELHKRLTAELPGAGLGRLESTLAETKPWPITQDASHHMGSTRMGADPATSVTNANGRLHGIDNVFCAGASVLPTSGCANPTFTLVALSIRLAAHLQDHLAQPRNHG